MASKSKSILVIDDDEDARFMVRYQIQEVSKDAIIYEMEDGAEALEFLSDPSKWKEKFGQEYPPSLILLDINMPKMNGFEFLDKYHDLVEKKLTPPIKFIMYTSSDLEKDIWRAQCYDEVIEYIVKPISKTILERILVD